MQQQKNKIDGLLQLIASLSGTIPVIAVDHEDESLRVLEVMPAVWNERPEPLGAVTGRPRASRKTRTSSGAAQHSDQSGTSTDDIGKARQGSFAPERIRRSP